MTSPDKLLPLRTRLVKLLRNRHFWVILILFVLVSLHHYVQQIGIAGPETSGILGTSRHAFDRILFLLPIIYSGFVFGLVAGLATAFAALLVMLPRAILVSPVPLDALLETAGVLTVGVLACSWLWTRSKERAKTEAALEALKTTHGVLQHYVQSMRKDERRLTILNSISTILWGTLELEELLRKATTMMSELMEVEITLLFRLDEETQELQLVGHEGVSGDFIRAVDRVKIGEGPYGEVAKTGEPVVIEDLSLDSELTGPEFKKMQIRVQLIVPLILKERVSGVACVAMRRPRQFSIDEIELLTAVGRQIATALDNAQLYEKERLAAQRLAISERNYRQLFENASDAIWTHDLEGNITVANKSSEKMTGYSIEELMRMNASQFMSAESLDIASQIRRKLFLKEPVKQPYEQHVIRRDGTEAILMLTTSLLTEDGKTIGFQNMARDVTEEKRGEELLKRSERELSQIVEGSSVPTFVINKEHILTHWNKACENLTTIPARELVGTKKQWFVFYPEERPVMADLIVANVPEEEIAKHYSGKYTKSDLIEGAYEARDFFPQFGEGGKWLFFTAAPLRNHEGEIFGAIETLQDVTAEKQMHENLRYYLQQITTAQEEERTRIARELHDDTAQALYALNRQVDNFVRSNNNLSADSTLFLRELGKQIRMALQSVRRFGQDLRPPMLDDLGLVATLRWLQGELKKRSGMEMDLVVNGSDRRLSPDIELLLFRIVQEALRNVEKHSKASKADVSIGFEDRKISITVSDNGIGCELPEKISDLSRSGKLGLLGMEERVRLLGGRLDISSELGKGTSVTIEAPIQQ